MDRLVGSLSKSVQINARDGFGSTNWRVKRPRAIRTADRQKVGPSTKKKRRPERSLLFSIFSTERCDWATSPLLHHLRRRGGVTQRTT